MAAQTQAVTAQPLVSVIMSVLNGEAFLARAIDSIIAQTYTNWEFIIIDDAGDNAVAEILHLYHDERIKVFRNDETKGLTANLNKAISIASGELIARMDADDISLPHRFEKQVKHLQQNQHLAGVAGFIEFIDEQNKPAGLWNLDRKAYTIKKIKSILPYENCIAHPTVILKKDVLTKYKYNTNQKHSQDWDLWLKLFSDGLYIDKLNEIVLQYRVHRASVTSIQKKKTAFEKKNETYRNYFISEEFKWNTFNMKVYACYLLNKLKMLGSNVKHKFSR